MKTLTLAGSEYFYLLVLPVLFWCVDERFGLRLGLVILLSTFFNAGSRSCSRQPRPYDFDPSVGLVHEPTFGLPSGHSQGTATFWGILAPAVKRPWGLVLALAVPAAIGFTRLYLGVHFPTDVFLGLALGWGIALAWYFFGHSGNLPRQVAYPRQSADGRGRRAVHERLAAFGHPPVRRVLRHGDRRGLHVPERCASTPRAAAWGRSWRGSRWAWPGLVALYVGGKLVSPGEGSSMYALARFVRYGLVGAWVSLGAPWLFASLKLSKTRARD